jgi:hypothetical protein
VATRPTIFKWRQTESAVILCAVRWYLRYSLSLRDVESSYWSAASQPITRRCGAGCSDMAPNWNCGYDGISGPVPTGNSELLGIMEFKRVHGELPNWPECGGSSCCRTNTDSATTLPSPPGIPSRTTVTMNQQEQAVAHYRRSYQGHQTAGLWAVLYFAMDTFRIA